MSKYEIADHNKIMQCLVDRDTRDLLYEFYGKLRFDLNDIEYIFNKPEKTRSDVVYMIVLCDWISEIHDFVFEAYSHYTSGFCFADADKLTSMRKQFRGIRSFAIAHPLNTNRHADIGYDGTKYAIDITPCGKDGELPVAFQLSLKVDKSKGSDFFIDWYVVHGIARTHEGYSYKWFDDFVCLTLSHINALIHYLSKIRKKDLYKFGC